MHSNTKFVCEIGWWLPLQESYFASFYNSMDLTILWPIVNCFIKRQKGETKTDLCLICWHVKTVWKTKLLTWESGLGKKRERLLSCVPFVAFRETSCSLSWVQQGDVSLSPIKNIFCLILVVVDKIFEYTV